MKCSQKRGDIVSKSGLVAANHVKSAAVLIKKSSVALFAAAFPEKCVLCGTITAYTEFCVCEQCRKKFHITQNCVQDEDDQRFIFYDHHYWLFDYGKPILKLIYAFKNGGFVNLSRFFASFAKSAIRSEFDMVSYVPSCAHKHKKRGFSHTFLLASLIAKQYRKPLVPLLYERERAQQKIQHFDQRFINTIGSFVYKSKPLRGQRVMLVDDILTTGATLNECARVIKKNGAACVLSLTITRVPAKYQKNPVNQV